MRSRLLVTALLGALGIFVATSSARAQVATGTYTGDGVSGRSFTGLGFSPDLVIIKLDDVSVSGVASTSTMGGLSKPIWETIALQGSYITSLDADGFTVGNDIRVNGNNICGVGTDPCVYYWTAFNADSNIVVGTYTGDGAATQAITGVGFAPDYLMIFGDANNWARNRWNFASSTVLGAGANFRIRNAGENSTSIPSLDADGFTVGNGNGDQEDSNTNTTTYHYVAFNEQAGGIKMGMYTGDGTNPRSVTGVGFQPIYVLVQSLDDGDQAYQKSDQMPAGDSNDFFNDLIAARIVGLLADGFQVSNDARVNSSGEDYTYVAFSGTGGASASLTQGHARWRNDDGPEGAGSPPLQVSATTDDSTASGTDVAVAGMSITPGAGDYIAWFSGSLENDLDTTNQFVSLYLGGAQVAHTERHVHTEGSIPDTSFPAATHAYLAGIGASEAVDVRWRTDGGTATMHERTLVLNPVNPADVSQATATADDTTSSGTDVVASGMSLTPSAGDYIVWFSGSVQNSLDTTDQFVSIYRNGVQVTHTERQITTEGSIPDTSFPVATHAYLAGVGGGEAIDIRWRTTGGTATMHERTLTVARVNAPDVLQASDTTDTATGSATDLLAPPLTLTPGAGNYLTWFSGSIENDTSGETQFASLYDNGARVNHTEREVFTEGSIPDTSFPIANHAVINGVGGGEAIEVRQRTTGGNVTMHERTLTLQRFAGVAGATWAAAEDTKLLDLTKGTTKRIRFAVSNGGAGSTGPIAYELQVAETATCGSGTYSTVPTGTSGHWQVIDSTFITDGGATNDVSPGLSNDATTFVAGELKDAGNTTGSITLVSDTYTEIEFSVQATTNATDGGDYCFRLYDATNNKVLDSYTSYAEVQLTILGGTITLADHDVGQVGDKFTSASSTNDVLFRFKLSSTPPVTITDLRVQYTTGSGVVDGDWSSAALYRDENADGLLDGGDTLLVSGVSGSGNALAFTALTEDPGAGTQYLVVATVSNLVPGDTTTISLGSADIDYVEFGVVEGGSIGNAIHTANAVRTIYYSVGTSVADLKNGAPTVTIASGIATFTTPQPANVGVGDEITYNGGTIAYVSGRSSAYVYSVTTRTGLVPPDIASAPVNSIRRAFNTLKVSTTGAADGTHLGTSDLLAADAQLHLACYNDGPDPSSYVRIEEPWITGPNNYIRVFTPTQPSEVGISQRHLGVAGTGYRIAPTGAAGIDFYNFILVSTDNGYVRIEGLEIDGSGLTNGENLRGLMANDSNVPQDIRFTHNLIHDLTNTTIDDGDRSRTTGIFLDVATNSKVANNIIYNITSVSAAVEGEARGIDSNNPGYTARVYNNTIYNVIATATSADATGIYDSGGNVVYARNNFVGLVNSTLGGEQCFLGPFAAENNNVSSDGTAVGAGSRNGETNYASYFVDVTPGSENLHLRTDSMSLWATTGADLSGDANLPVTDDIDGEPRHPSTPDIGADESVVATNYRSIGTAPNYSTGTIDVTAGSPIVTGTSTSWLTANRGRGDHIAFNLEEYTVLSVDSETQITLATPVASTFTGGYTISRQFTTLAGWEDCISGSGGCTYFPVASSNLVNDGRAEVGIMYNDSAVPNDPDFTGDVNISGSTTDATHTITLTADGPNRHYGIPGAGVLSDCTSCTSDSIRVSDDYVTVEWVEVRNNMTGSSNAGIKATEAFNVEIRYILSHDNWNGIRQSGNPGKSTTVRNSIVYNNTSIGIEGDEPGDVLVVENCTAFGNGDRGVWGALSTTTTTVRNTISMGTIAGADFENIGTQENNISEDATASCGTCLANRDVTDLAVPGAPPQGNGWVMFMSLAGGSEDFHLRNDVAQNDAQDNAQDLSARFTRDIDLGVRVTPWDVGADDAAATTAVNLIAFDATPLDGAVELTWETGSELDNLGFHLYRSTTLDGDRQRITTELIPGLGSSPAGARYRFRDDGLTNGVTYYYHLDDMDTTGVTTTRGPVTATPEASAGPMPKGEDDGDGTAKSWITFGEPTANRFELLSWNESGAVVELVTEGFYAEPVEDGSVMITAPGLEPLGDGYGVAVPVSRPWIEAVTGVGVKVVAIDVSNVEAFSSLRPLDSSSRELVANVDGVVRTGSRRRARRRGWIPHRATQIRRTRFHGETKQAQLELAPLRWNGNRSELRLARRIRVTLAFTGRPRDEFAEQGRYRRRKRQDVIARFGVTSAGLHVVHYHEIFGADRRVYDTATLGLSRLGEPVAFHVVPEPHAIGPGSKLYFWSAGADINPYDGEAVYELAWTEDETMMMRLAGAAPSGDAVGLAWSTSVHEVDRYYQPALLSAPDLWLWDLLMSGEWKTYDVALDAVAASTESGRLSVWLQGASDLDVSSDHHVSVSVNGVYLGDSTWDGKSPRRIDVELPPGVLSPGSNRVELVNVGDTGAAYSMVFLDRFEIVYPRALSSSAGRFSGEIRGSGAVVVSGLSDDARALDVTDPEAPVWLTELGRSADGFVAFRAEAKHSYLVVDPASVQNPTVTRAANVVLQTPRRGADYLLIGPEAFLSAAKPLVRLRRDQGLRVKSISVEQIWDEFGYGESRPEAIHDFLAYAYHEWRAPQPRYVLLLGDGSYDFKDRMQTGVPNPLPPLMVPTSFLWTASDPALAMVEGDDQTPDIAIGRLPARDVHELQTMVNKILAFEAADASFETSPLVLVADNPDRAGDFVANAEEIASSILPKARVEKIYLSELGPDATRSEIIRSFDVGASLMSYIGHGGIHLWADENILNLDDVGDLSSQAQQPLFITMNCLNGYFHFPFFDSLSESLVKVEGRGAIAAFSPTGLSLDTPAHRFHKALLDALVNGEHERLGDAVISAQQSYARTGAFPELLMIYHLLGDPALTLK